MGRIGRVFEINVAAKQIEWRKSSVGYTNEHAVETVIFDQMNSVGNESRPSRCRGDKVKVSFVKNISGVLN